MRMARDEIDNGLPLVQKHHFVVDLLPSKEVRDERVYRRCEQPLMCPRVRVARVVDDGTD